MEIYKNTNLQDLEGELWVDVYGFDGLYEVSNLGRVKSLERYVRGCCSERIVKSRILKQSFSGSLRNRVAVGLSSEGICTRREINVIAFYSFYPEKMNDSKTMEICHMNKLATDNRLSNLQLLPVSDSKKIGYEHGVCDGLIHSNNKRAKEYDKLIERYCVQCSIIKPIQKFKRGYHKCRRCEYVNKIAKKGKKLKDRYTIEITDVVTGIKTVNTNKKKCIVSKPIIDRYANTGKQVLPYRNSKHKNPILIVVSRINNISPTVKVI